MLTSLRLQGIGPKTVIDVGANVGQFAVACAKIFPGSTIYSFEPTPKCVEKFKKHISRLEGIHIFQTALGEQRGEAMLHVNSFSQSSSILSLAEAHRRAFPQARETHTIRVPVSTLDAELDSVSMDSPVLLKLDVQGYELRVLQGSGNTLEKVDYVLIEASFRPMFEGEVTFVEVVRRMEQSGFEFMRPVAWLTAPATGEVLQADALFVRRQRSPERST